MSVFVCVRGCLCGKRRMGAAVSQISTRRVRRTTQEARTEYVQAGAASQDTTTGAAGRCIGTKLF
eukprot:164256-Amphidinium_carterae.3